MAEENLKHALETAAEKATPNNKIPEKMNKLSHNIQELIQAKRKIRRQWQQQNSSLLKFNQAIKILRLALREETKVAKII